MFFKITMILLFYFSNKVFGTVSIEDLRNDFNVVRDEADESFQKVIEEFVPSLISCEGGNLTSDVYENCSLWVEEHHLRLEMPSVPVFGKEDSTDCDLMIIGRTLYKYKEILRKTFEHVVKNDFKLCSMNSEENPICNFKCPDNIKDHWNFCCFVETRLSPAVNEALVDLQNFLKPNISTEVTFSHLSGSSPSYIRKIYLGLTYNLFKLSTQADYFLENYEPSN